jgi:hypothetical protein
MCIQISRLAVGKNRGRINYWVKLVVKAKSRATFYAPAAAAARASLKKRRKETPPAATAQSPTFPLPLLFFKAAAAFYCRPTLTSGNMYGQKEHLQLQTELYKRSIRSIRTSYVNYLLTGKTVPKRSIFY